MKSFKVFWIWGYASPMSSKSMTALLRKLDANGDIHCVLTVEAI